MGIHECTPGKAYDDAAPCRCRKCQLYVASLGWEDGLYQEPHGNPILDEAFVEAQQTGEIPPFCARCVFIEPDKTSHGKAPTTLTIREEDEWHESKHFTYRADFVKYLRKHHKKIANGILEALRVAYEEELAYGVTHYSVTYLCWDQEAKREMKPVEKVELMIAHMAGLER